MTVATDVGFIEMQIVKVVGFGPPLAEESFHCVVLEEADTGRHAGQADIIRELIDGTAGRTRENTNLPSADQVWWQAHRDQVERAAREAAKASNG
jgi:hypothetical protein